MVEPGQEKQRVSKVAYCKRYSLSVGLDEVLSGYKFIHPVAGKGQQIPEDDQIEKNPEFAPAMIGLVGIVKTVK